MSEVENISADKSANKGLKGKSRKKRIVLAYITVPVAFAFAAALLFSPVMIGLTSVSDKYISAVEEEFPITEGDIEAAGIEKISAENQIAYEKGSFVGTVVCENAGINESIYFGVNRASLRNGVALSENGSLFKDDGTDYLSGYYSAAFKALPSVEAGDTIEITVEDRVFEYEVIEISSSASGISADLVLSCTDDYSFYGSYNKFVFAKLVSESQLTSQGEVAQ